MASDPKSAHGELSEPRAPAAVETAILPHKGTELGCLLVAGYDSDNVVELDLSTGRWSEVARLPKGSKPRGIAIGDDGEIFLGLRGAKKNLARLVLGEGPAQLRNVTGPIGRFGPGLILFDRGRIWAAGDSDRRLHLVNLANGEVSIPEQFRSRHNLVGLAITDKALYAAEYFQRSVLRYDISGDEKEPERFIWHDRHLNRPVGLAIGRNETLCVGNAREPTVVEFDLKSGAFVRTLVDLGAGGKEGIYGIVYAPTVQRYYIASGSAIYEVDAQGMVLARYSSPALKRAYGMALAPAGLELASAQRSSSSHGAHASASIESAGLPPTPPLVTMLKAMPGKLQISGTPGERYELQASTDLRTWQRIATLENSNGTLEFSDPDAARFGQRFYRISILPDGR